MFMYGTSKELKNHSKFDSKFLSSQTIQTLWINCGGFVRISKSTKSFFNISKMQERLAAGAELSI